MIRGIIKKLRDTSGVTTLVDADNIYPVVAKQDAPRPYITVRRTSELPQVMKGQTSNTDKTSFNVTAYAETYKQAIEILYAVRVALDGLNNTEIQTVKLLSVWYENSQDLYDKEDFSFVIVDTYVARWSRL